MVNKPRSRKRQGHFKRNSVVALILLGVLAAGAYYYYYYLNSTTGSGCPAPPTGRTGVVYACINTSKGSFEVELFSTSAPKTVANFVNLAKSGFYDNLVWHRITHNPPVIQTGDSLTRNGGGDRSTWGTGGSTTQVPLEVTNSSLHNDRGYLAMAHTSTNTNATSQFYINTQDNRFLDTQYTVFGRVVSGMSVVDALAAVQTYNSSGLYPEQPVDPTQAILLTITILSGS